ncbi:MAG TPA: hypothetical protein VET48_08375, partial [Steroidobacteraceae bacterium]|nr:hypothetical protein [Steroidobacteraceae bacterium]
GPNGLMLRGRCVDAELLPKYLQTLTMEPELAGARFDQVVIDHRRHHDKDARDGSDKDNDSPFVRFSVSSDTALKQIERQGS